MTKEELQQAIEVAKKNLAAAETALTDFISAPENNVFDNLEDAVETIEDRLRGQAGEDCEGSYNCGADEYEQEFIVNGIRYLGTLRCEYNRHDKTYYYLDGAEFTYKVLDDEGQG